MLDFVTMRLIPIRLWVMAVLAGVLQVLPFPIAGPVPVWRTVFCWVALAPLLKALTGKDINGQTLRISQGAALGYCCGFVWYLGNCYWVYDTMHLYGGISKLASVGILILFCMYLGLYHALFGALIVAFRRNRFGMKAALLLTPFAWVAVELARARITSFPWDLLGITQVDNPLLTRLAPYTGAYGISFIIAAVNTLWLSRITLKQRKYTRPLLALSGILIAASYIFVLRRSTPNQDMTSGQTHQNYGQATLLQENLEVGAANTGPQLTKTQMLSAFTQLSLFPPDGNACNGIPELASTKCVGQLLIPNRGNSDATVYTSPTNLIVWPEAPAPFQERDSLFRAAMSSLARAANAPLIVGNIGVDADPKVSKGYNLHNSAEFIRPDGSFAGRYDKMHLVPFGEYVPYKKLFFFAGDLLADVGEFDPGTLRSTFSSGGHTYGTFICYESIFGDEIREFTNMGADVLVNISDDGWYGDTSAAWEHLNMVRMRAIENHRWILRATNTGVTGSIDPYGRMLVSAPRHIRTSLRVGFNYEHDVTFYAAHGDLFAYLCALITVVGFGSSRLGKDI
jgi:apolipoprotein N-acyltransferase